MAHYTETHAKRANPLMRLVLRLVGIACLMAIPGVWIATPQALPEARIVGLALSVVLMGAAGLCLSDRR
ncbi:hypothetical protein [Marivita sp. GX14005]|uniref:hypothetical protein n=1 Tax=Marivita sp. GX14005 TaxID=2942276 RepID=UPI0020189268|nr:hypothetical protein [Marivita sp. GX14005]MCL3883472.1 hypothetical protein [Marivita sp. GX14005]